MDRTKFDETAVVQEWVVAQPGAGAEWSITVPTGQVYKFETGFFTLATSAAVANRVVKIQILDPNNNPVWEGGIQGVFPASQTGRAGLTRLGGQTAASGSGVPNIVALPDVHLPAGYTLKTLTGSIDVADQYSAVRGLVSAASGS